MKTYSFSYSWMQALRVAVFAILPLAPFSVSASDLICAEIFHQQEVPSVELFLQKLNEDRPEFQNLVKSFMQAEALPKDLVLGLVTPTWEDFQTLQTLISELRNEITTLESDPKSQSALQKIYEDMNHLWSLSKRGDQVYVLSREFSGANKTYGPTDYSLRVAYRVKLQDLNSLLPLNARFPELQFPPDRNKEKVNEDARTIVRSLKKMLDFQIKKEGVRGQQQFVTDLRASPENTRAALDLLEKDEFEFGMRRPSRGRFWIEKVGFHNQHITKKSGGYFGPEGRDGTEGSLINIKYQKYSSFDNDLKPKYGLLLPRIGSRLKLENDAPRYGEDTYLFKKEALSERVSFALGDSLNSVYALGRNWDTSTFYAPSRWDQMFLPWSRKELIAPFLSHMISEDRYAGYGHLQKSAAYGIDDSKGLERSVSNSEYIELQYWGTINLDQVHSFIFTSTPPDGDFLEALQKRNIKIFQNSKGTITPWEAHNP